MRHYLSVADLAADELSALLDRALYLKREPVQAQLPRAHGAALLFERPSLRTRTAYEVALMVLGGRAIAHDTRLGDRETVGDVARSLSQLVSVIVARVRDHATLEMLAAEATVPVVNALSDREHPVEVLADALTLRERWGDLRKRRLAYVGDGNNICRSLLLLAPLLGMDLAVATPDGYAPAAAEVLQAYVLAERYGTQVRIGSNPQTAVTGADVIYTDVWAGMGPETSAEEQRSVFAPYQINGALLALAQPHAVVLHCLPARRGEEITSDVLDGAQSLAFARLSNLWPVKAALLGRLLEQAQ